MNRKVIKTMLFLVILELIAWYILKIFMPSEFMLIVNNKQLIQAGQYIDSHLWAYYLFGIGTSFITYWLFLCAVCKKPYLKLKENILILITIGTSIGLSFVDNTIVSIFGFISFVLLPVLLKCNDLKTVSIVFTVHTIAQYLSLQIRELPLYIQYQNSLSFLILTLECYFWLFLFYLYFNYKKSIMEIFTSYRFGRIMLLFI